MASPPQPALGRGYHLRDDYRGICLAAILDAWSRRVVGYGVSRSIDARLTIAALKAAIRAPQASSRMHSSS